MRNVDWSRREFLRNMGLGSAALALPGLQSKGEDARVESRSLLSVDPKPKFELSPYLYMRFMEPLGTTDTSAE